MRALILILTISFFSFSVQGQDFSDEIYKRSGEAIFIEIQSTEQVREFYIYRKNSMTGPPARVAIITAIPGQFVYHWQTSMPNSTTPQYRFFAVPIKLQGNFYQYGPQTNEGLVTRR